MASLPSLPKNPVIGDPRLVSDLLANDTALQTSVNNIDISQCSGLVVPDANLTSANNSVYRAIRRVTGSGGVTPSSKFGFTSAGVFSNVGAALSGGVLLDLIRIEAADYTVASKTTKMRVQVNWHNTQATYVVTYTYGLFPVTAVSFSGSTPTYTVGTAISGSTVAFAPGTPNTIIENNSGDFTLPADGYYVLGYTTSAGVAAAGEVPLANVELSMRHV